MKNEKRGVWIPQKGSQERFLSCPVFECLYEGSRGPGKTDALIMDFAQHVGCGHGKSWRGILFRHTYKQLEDVVAKSKKWFYQIFPDAKFRISSFKWIWPDGEELLLRYMARPDDYWEYHGHEYSWIGWEELTNWPTADCYESMLSCCRSSDLQVPRKYRATCNPYGVGHSWVKNRFIDSASPGVIMKDELGRSRVRIHGSIHENKILMEAQPEYLRQLESITDTNKKKAWLTGNWDIVSGGALDDVWVREKHVIEPFNIPSTWRIDRSFDWGSSKPFSVGWWAESDGSDVILPDGIRCSFQVGTLFRIAELYGWNGRPNVGCKKLAVEIARDIVFIESHWKFRVFPGPADNSIFNIENGHSISEDMERIGVRWERSDKSPGSRKTGLEKLRARLKASIIPEMGEPGLFVFSTCNHFIRTVPVLIRSGLDPDDIDTNCEDHIYDEVRYRLMFRKSQIIERKLKGF